MSANGKPKLGLIYERMARIMEQVPAIGKDGENKVQNFRFRSIDQVYDVLHRLLADNHVFFTPHVVSQERQVLDRLDKQSGKKVGHTVLTCLSVKYIFHCADDGSCLEVGPIPAEAADSGDKASAKALSMALKYVLLQTFCIPIQAEADFKTEPDESGADAAQALAEKRLKGNGGEDEVAKALQAKSQAECNNFSLSPSDLGSLKRQVFEMGARSPKQALDLLNNVSMRIMEDGAGMVLGVHLEEIPRDGARKQLAA